MNKSQGKQLERYYKGMANHWRIRILFLVSDKPGLSVEEIAQILKGNFKTISSHIQKLVTSGLVNKWSKSNFVFHKLSPYGKKFIEFTKGFLNS